jgi:hypothetical protein
MDKKEVQVSDRLADVYLIKSGCKYKAEPSRARFFAPTPGDVLRICNLTGSEVRLWFPGDFLVGNPAADVYALRNTEAKGFTVPERTERGVYSYAAYVVEAKEFVEGNTPPDIIIDK